MFKATIPGDEQMSPEDPDGSENTSCVRATPTARLFKDRGKTVPLSLCFHLPMKGCNFPGSTFACAPVCACAHQHPRQAN